MRTDEYLFVKGFFDSRTKAKKAIEKGEVFINGKCVLKPSKEIDENSSPDIKIKRVEKFVSLGGYKLSKALKDFSFDVKDMIVADVGASTGGFTDCLVTNGAKKVYAVDLNDELLHESLRKNEKVVRVIKNAKFIVKKDFDKLDLITADLSFISATQVLKVFYDLLDVGKNVILLIKPQFEVGEKRKFKNGVIKDDIIRRESCRKVYDCAISVGFSVLKMTTAPIYENKNVEFLVLLEKNSDYSEDFDNLYDFNF